MSEFPDNELRKALERRDAPAGFAERVLSNLPDRRQSRHPAWYLAVAAVLATVMVFAGAQHRQHERVRANQTERQVVFAIALAMEKFEHVNARLQQSAPKVKVDAAAEEGERL